MTTNKYIGTKLITSTLMNRADYNTYRGWELPSNEDGADEGYLVEYMDVGKPNDSRHAGYISWSPKTQHEAAYRPCDAMTFGLAIEALKKGLTVSRAGWNGKGMWLTLVGAGRYEVLDHYAKLQFSGQPVEDAFLPWIGMKTADNKFVPWLASQTDTLAEDWCIV